MKHMLKNSQKSINPQNNIKNTYKILFFSTFLYTLTYIR